RSVVGGRLVRRLLRPGGGVLVWLGHLGEAVAQAAEQRPRAAVAAVAHARVVEPLADPALVGRARRAQLADHAPLAAVQEDVGVLAAQQCPSADVARNDRVRCRDGLPGHAATLANPRPRPPPSTPGPPCWPGAPGSPR